MTPQLPQKNGQLNLNTILLSVCVGLSGWALKSIEDLKVQVAGTKPLINANSSAIVGINSVIFDHAKSLEEMSVRLTKLETKQSDQKK